MSDETIIYFDEISTYSGGVWPSVAIGMPEVQAHAMSYPQAQDDQIRQIQDDVRRGFEIVLGVPVQEPVDDLTAARNEIQRLSAELAHRTQVWEGEEFRLRGELSEARAEIVSLLEEVARLRGCAPVPSCQTIKTALPAATLDHRLGLPQPDGDPVAPMSAKKPYRWGMV